MSTAKKSVFWNLDWYFTSCYDEKKTLQSKELLFSEIYTIRNYFLGFACTALILMSFLLHLSLTLCTFEPSTYKFSNIHERPSSCLESNLVKSLLIVGGKLLIVGNTKCHLEHDFKVLAIHFSWSLCNRHCWACKILNWWYILLLKCHLVASCGTRFDSVPSSGSNLSPSILYKSENCLVRFPNGYTILNF